ncbi:hypothetical protein ACH495_17330 [Micromonospora sp. NPDC018662]|uniref:hypothetical protein n=1 Tax=Micromonospora sp. NPDC018662 TaxID=3364238 RepID=UPI0037B2079C
MTNTGNDATTRRSRTKVLLLAVTAAWLVAALTSWALWLASDDGNPESPAAMVAGTVIPGLVAIAIVLVLDRLTRRRQRR